MTDTPDQTSPELIRKARSRFYAMAATYGLGVFNDSFYRQAAILMAIDLMASDMEGWVMAVFTLPYLVFASYAGWLADRFSKRYVVIGAKALEVVAMAFGAVGICLENWTFILLMTFIMGTQSCLFGPALNGSIPELYPAEYVTRANARLKVIVTVMILGGVTAAGWALGIEGTWRGVDHGQLAVAFGVIAIALLGLGVSFGVPSRPAADPRARFPLRGPLETFSQLRALRDDKLMTLVVALNGFTWFAGTLLVLLISALAITQLGLNKPMAANLVGSELIGLAVGGLLAGRLARGHHWYWLLVPSGVTLGVTLLAVAAVPYLPDGMQLPVLFPLLAVVGMAGGLVLIPCEAFIQTRPRADIKGRVIAAANFVAFFGILLGGPVNNLLKHTVDPTQAATTGFAILGVLDLLVMLWLWFHVAKGDLR
jgi:MFS family permease